MKSRKKKSLNKRASFLNAYQAFVQSRKKKKKVETIKATKNYTHTQSKQHMQLSIHKTENKFQLQVKNSEELRNANQSILPF